jgi:hypothetical protein
VNIEDVPYASPKQHFQSPNQKSVDELPFQNLAIVTYSSPKVLVDSPASPDKQQVLPDQHIQTTDKAQRVLEVAPINQARAPPPIPR